jgi:hypothetical protein
MKTFITVYLQYAALIIISLIVFLPIDEKFKFSEKYQDKSNKRFRLIIMSIGLLSISIGLLIGFLSDGYLRSIGLKRDLLTLIYIIPGLFVLQVVKRFRSEK